MKDLKSRLNSDSYSHSKSGGTALKSQMMHLADDMSNLTQKLHDLNKETELVLQKAKTSHKKIRKIIYSRNKKIEEAIAHDDFTEKDFVSVK